MDVIIWTMTENNQYMKKETAHGLFLKCLFNNHINESIHFVGLIWGQASNARTEKVL